MPMPELAAPSSPCAVARWCSGTRRSNARRDPRNVSANDRECSQFVAASTTMSVEAPITIQRTTAARPPTIISDVGR